MPPQGRPQAAGRSSQFQRGKYEIFPGRGDVQPESQPEASPKPTKPLFLIARSQPNGKQRPDLAGLLRKPTRGIVPSTLLRLWEGQCLHAAWGVQPVSAR